MQPASLQFYNSVMNIPWVLKFIFGIVVDAKLVQYRKKYIIGFGFMITIVQFCIVIGLSQSPLSTCVFMILYNIGAAFIDATVDSMVVQQARRDSVNGQQDLYCFSFLFFGLGAAMASVLAAIVTQNNVPRIGFGFGAAVTLFITICGFCIDKTLETNKYATAIGPEQEEYERA